MSSVVKANAYGHGINEFAPLVEAEGINHFSVFDYHEALKLHKVLNKNSTIMIMGWIGKNNLEDVIRKGFEFFVFDPERLEQAVEIARYINIPAKIHLEVETGMNRSGLNKREFIKALNFINENKSSVIVSGLCSHLAGAESIANHVRVIQQIKSFDAYKIEIKKHNIEPEYYHLACSAATMSYPGSRQNLVRIGIMQYGFWSSKEVFLRYTARKKDFIDPLERVIGLKSEIMSIKEIKKGKFISYGTTYLAQNDMKTAIVPIGYSKGYSRSFSNRGRILIKGQLCYVIGLVNMNMIIADVSYIADLKIGDEVVLIGSQNDLTISVDSFSEISQQINYEILSRLPNDIPRIIIK
ncbi:MAG: alanine racemase [Candidatus Delongbacteria bacterium]|nr:alanine racemase [Candidatus Delongbacteria bacterium]